MKHKAQEALENLLKNTKINHHYCSDECVSFFEACGTNACPQERDDNKEELLIKEFAKCQLTVEEINMIKNCLAVACFDSKTYNSLFNKLKQQKEMWEVE